jgi:hypothetical protein
MKQIKDKLSKVLLNKPRVITRAVLWSIYHDSGKEDIGLKLGRYTKPKEMLDDEKPETLQPKSELTLDDEEFKSLIEFIRDNYEPFRHGTKAFIPLDKPFEAESAAQIRALFSLPDKKQIVQFILSNKIIPEQLAIGLEQAHRISAIQQFEQMLEEDHKEPVWQDWFKKNSWVLGSEFVRILDERQIDTRNISDFLMEAYDGFLDIVEIKRPEGDLRFWAATLDHGNYIPSQDLMKAITQSTRYIFEVEREANSAKFLARVGQVKIVKPRCILIFGRSNDWNPEQVEAYRIMNAGYHNLTVMTYDYVLERAKRILGLAARV